LAAQRIGTPIHRRLLVRQGHRTAIVLQRNIHGDSVGEGECKCKWEGARGKGTANGAMEHWELGSAGVFQLHTLGNDFPRYIGLTARYTW